MELFLEINQHRGVERMPRKKQKSESTLHVRLTKIEHAHLRTLAKKKNVTMTQIVKDALRAIKDNTNKEQKT